MAILYERSSFSLLYHFHYDELYQEPIQQYLQVPELVIGTSHLFLATYL